MDIIKLTPSIKANVWGGKKLKNYGKCGEVIGEAWELSFHPDGPCLMPDGTPLKDAVTQKELGSNLEGMDFFPTLIKFIDADDNLSVQVHPSDSYALENEGQLGKTEMWYVVDAEPGAGIYMGFKKTVTPEQFAAAIEDNTVLDLLNFIAVKPGEHYFIKAGTVHAIGKGVTIYEIQQNSNVTYRVYDYDRRDASGNPRQLHVEKAKAVSCLKGAKPLSPAKKAGKLTMIGVSKYFTVYRADLDGSMCLNVDERSFRSISAVKGGCKINGKEMRLGDTFFVPAGTGRVKLEGCATLIITAIERLTVLEDGKAVKLLSDGRCIASGTGEDTSATVERLLSKFGADASDLI